MFGRKSALGRFADAFGYDLKNSGGEGYRKLVGLPAAPLEVPVPHVPAPQSATTVGRLVVMLDRSYGNYSDRRATLEAEITERTEELRQVNAALTSLGAALMATAEDPALTDDERAKAEAPMDTVLGQVDLAGGTWTSETEDGGQVVTRAY